MLSTSVLKVSRRCVLCTNYRHCLMIVRLQVFLIIFHKSSFIFKIYAHQPSRVIEDLPRSEWQATFHTLWRCALLFPENVIILVAHSHFHCLRLVQVYPSHVEFLSMTLHIRPFLNEFNSESPTDSLKDNHISPRFLQLLIDISISDLRWRSLCFPYHWPMMAETPNICQRKKTPVE
jgi:hypothetical protein